MRRTNRGENTRKSPKSNNLAQYGLFDIPTVEDFDPGMDAEDDDDDDLEAELDMILSSGAPRPSPRSQAKPKVPEINLDAMVAASLKDVPSDASDDDGEEDPSLLAELNMFTGEENEHLVDPTPVMIPTSSVILPTSESASGVQAIDVISVLRERTAMYVQAESMAKENNDMAKARRLKRGLDQLKILLRKAESGGLVTEEEIPLPVTIPAKKEPVPTTDTDPSEIAPNQPQSPSSDISQPTVADPPLSMETSASSEVLKTLSERRDEYKRAAISAKSRGDRETALAHIKVIKQFEAVIAAAESGQEVDLSHMPPPPSEGPPVSDIAPPVPPRSKPSSPQTETIQQSSPDYDPPPPQPMEPVTVMGALESRLAKFKEQEEAAKTDNNSRKQRMMGRIVKQYEDAIRLHKAGRPFPVDELPTPPGFPPIPVETKPTAPTPDAPSGPTPEKESPPAAKPPAPGPPLKPAPAPPLVKPSPPALTTKETRNEKQLATLLHKQKEFKLAALKAKQSGDLVRAKEYLRQAKHFDTVIEASRSGLPVDMDTLPRSPSKSSSLDSFEVVTITDCLPGSAGEIYERLLNDLKKQIEMCAETRSNFKAMGDVANANRFEHMIFEMKRGYDIVKAAKLNSNPVPSFKYEKRHFSIVRCNTDLNDNDLEIAIIQGINFNVPNPKEIDTYVRCEFPSANEEPKRFKTPTIYNTNNPQYKSTFMVPIQRNSRSFVRLFKRQAVKMEVWSKGGFLRSDSMLGTVQVKLQPLETKCAVHDAFDIMDGRKPIGGKVEIKLRVRTPMLTKEMEQIEEKWLVID